MKTVRTFRANFILIITVALLLPANDSNAESPLKKLRLPFQKKQVEADPNASYELTESNGPWMVMAASFVGEEGEVQARELMMEIRREMNLPAYVYKRHFDFSGEVVGRDFQLDKDDPERVIRRRMKHQLDASFEETAVLVGDYPGLDDPQSQKVLELIKYAKPESIPTGENAANHQRMGMIRGSVPDAVDDENSRIKGPMGVAFLTPNPMLPEEYFRQQGPDEFILKLNKKVDFSLLDCPGKFSVRVATFRGDTTFDPEEIKEKKADFKLKDMFGKPVESKLHLAADKAHRLTEALRKRKIEAYEFHDRFESFVCVGAFESVGTPRRDGRVEINPEVHKVIEYYKAEQETLPGLAGFSRPKNLPELPKIPFDLQPVPVQVPRVSALSGATGRGQSE